MEEAVEKALVELILQADRDGRKKVWEALAKAFDALRRNRIKDKLKQAATFILDARGDVVRNDQRLVLATVATVNRGLIRAGEEAPDGPPAATLAALIDDPRGKEEAVAKVKEPAGEAVEADEYKNLGRLDILRAAAADSLDATLEQAALRQEDVRNRSQHVAERAARSPRYTFLRIGLLSLRQGNVASLLSKALTQVSDYGKPSEALGPGPPAPPDPMSDRTRERLTRQVHDLLACAEDADRLLQANQFGPLAVGLQSHVHRGARELRMLMQETERKHKLHLDRQATRHQDAFGRPYLLREKNLDVTIEEAKNLEWALVLAAAAQRESELLAAAAPDRLLKSTRGKCEELSALIGKSHAALLAGLQDPTDPAKENEKVKPLIEKKVLAQLDPKAFADALAQLDRKEYQALALKQDGLRRAISAALVSLADLLEAPVPPEKATDHLANLDTGEVVADSGGFIEYRDEQPAVLADLIEKEGGWIDQQVGNPDVRKEMVRRLRAMPRFDPRYARLQSAYFQALAQHFQAKGPVRPETDGKPQAPRPKTQTPPGR
jgi:hypothetical protein